MRRFFDLLLPFVVAGCLRVSNGARVADLAIRDVAVVDVDAGKIVNGRTVLIAGGRITGVQDGGARVIAERIIDGRGKYLIPGLWDLHVHAVRNGRAAWMFPLFVANGVLGVRDTGSPLDSLLHYRRAVAAGGVLGPRIVGSGPLLDGAKSQWPDFSVSIATADAGRRAVDSLAGAGADFIKVYDLLPRDAFFAIARRARERGLPVIGHVPISVSPVAASDSGMKSIEHLTLAAACIPALPQLFAEVGAYASRPGVSRDSAKAFTRALPTRAAAAYDSKLCRAAAERLARNGTALVPTLSRERAWSHAYLASAQAGADPNLRYVPMSVRSIWQRWRDSIVTSGTAEDDRGEATRYALFLRIVRVMRQGGVVVLPGTDTDGNDAYFYGVPGLTLHAELETLVTDVGFTPAEALRAATLGATRFLGMSDSLGTIEPGKLADVVLLDGNPLADIRNTSTVRAVVRGGRLLDRPTLDDMLARQQALAARR